VPFGEDGGVEEAPSEGPAMRDWDLVRTSGLRLARAWVIGQLATEPWDCGIRPEGIGWAILLKRSGEDPNILQGAGTDLMSVTHGQCIDDFPRWKTVVGTHGMRETVQSCV